MSDGNFSVTFLRGSLYNCGLWRRQGNGDNDERNDFIKHNMDSGIIRFQNWRGNRRKHDVLFLFKTNGKLDKTF